VASSRSAVVFEDLNRVLHVRFISSEPLEWISWNFSEMFSPSRLCAESMFEPGRLKVSSGVWRFEQCLSICANFVWSITTQPLEGIKILVECSALKTMCRTNVPTWLGQGHQWCEPCILCPVHIFWTPGMNIMKLRSIVQPIKMMCMMFQPGWLKVIEDLNHVFSFRFISSETLEWILSNFSQMFIPSRRCEHLCSNLAGSRSLVVFEGLNHVFLYLLHNFKLLDGISWNFG
jgi:hypothetical protein